MLKLNKFPLLFPWKHNKTKIMAEDATDGAVAEVVVVPNEELRPCNVCGRTFLPRSLATHSRVCERNATRKRKVFDSLKQRVEGTDLAPFHQKTYLKKTDAAIVTSTTTDAARPSKWKEKHLELVNAIRAAKGASTMPSPPKRSSTTLGTPTHERCPSCERQFGPKAYDRHVEWCKERRTTIHKSPASVVMAKERLEARTKYKVPPLNKSKRALTREKYSPQMSRTESIASMKSSSSCLLDRSPSVRKSKSVLYPRKSIDKIEQNEPKPENVEKNVGDSIPITKKNPHEPVKSSHAKRTLPSSKINSIAVNDGVGGLTVSSLDAKKMTTWKETTNAPKTEPSPTPTCRSDDVRRGPKIITGKSPRKPSSKIAKITKTNPIKKADVVLEKHKVTPDVGKMTVHLENVATGFCFESGVNLRTPPGDEDEFRLKSTSSKCVGCDESCFAESDSNPLVEFDATANSNVAVEELECDYFKKCESNEIDEGCLENDVYDVEYYNRQVADLRDKLLSVDASKRTLSVEIASEGSNKEIAVGKLIDLNDEDVRCEHSQRAVNPEVVLSNSEVASINPEVISINSEIVSIKHEVVSIKHEVVSINHEVVPINYEAVPINHEVVPTNHEAVPINHEAVPINHEALPINHEAVLINHEVVPTNHQAVPINHEAVPINHEAVPINHEVVPTNHEAVPINHEGNETKKPTSCVDGLSCIDRYKFDKKRMYCEKFLERNRLVDYACFEGAQGKNIEIESPCGDHVGKCAIDFPLEISQSKEDEEIEFKNPAYYDSLDDSVSSDDFKDDLTSNVSPPTADKMLHWRKTNYFSDCESVVDGYENEHSLALSAARIEREIRKCCSDICLHKSSESSFVSFTDVDLKKFSSDECTNIRDEIDKLTTDQILEIAAEEFVSSLKEPILFGNDAVTSTPVSHKKNAPPLTDIVPSKRRKLDENAVDSLIKNIERIKMRKVDDLLEIPQTSEERFKDMVQKGENLLNHQANGSIDGFETKRILSTIDEASSNASTVLPRIAEENRRKPRIRSSSEDSRTPRTRPVSNTSSNVSPRLLHVIRSVLNPELTVTPRELYSMEEDLVRVSRVHCRKMLKMSRQVLDEILDKEPLRLPKIAQKDTIERRKSPSKNVKLPEIKQKIGVNEGERKAYFKFAMPFANSLKGIVKSADSKREKSDVDVDVVSTLDYNPFLSAERQLKELLECDDFDSSITTTTIKPQHPTRPHTTPTTVKPKHATPSTKKHAKSNKPKSPAVKKRASVIDPPVSFQDRDSMLKDDFEMLENIINDNYNRELEQNVHFSLNAILNRREYADDFSATIDPRLINENDNLSIPDSLKMDDVSPTSGPREIKLQQSISMLDDECLEDAQIDELMITLSEADDVVRPSDIQPKAKKADKFQKSNRSLNSSFGYAGSTVVKDKKKNLSSLKRSISLLDPVQKPKPLKNRQDVQNYFNETKSPIKSDKTYIKIEIPKVDEKPIITPKPEELFSVDDEMYEEYKKYEEMYLKEKEEMLKKEERKIGDGHSGPFMGSEDDDNQHITSKVSADSAYGSLNRKTPKVRARSTKLTPLESHRILIGDSASSSGSESSPILTIPSNNPCAQKISKFCHECGNKYPLTTAKFCVECGVKRLVL